MRFRFGGTGAQIKFGKGLDTILLHHRIQKYPDSHAIGLVVDLFFPSGKRIQKYPDSLPNSPGCVWKEAVSGKKKLRIQK